MGQCQTVRPQGGGAGRLAAVADVPQQGQAAGGELHPYLVGAACVQAHPHQRQAVGSPLHGVVQRRLADALAHPLDHIALVVGGIPEQQVGEGVAVLFRRAPEDSQILLGDPVLRNGGSELSGDLPAAGEQHHTAHGLVQPVDGGNVVGLALGAVVLPQQGGHTGAVGAVLRQHAHGLDAQHKVRVLVQDTKRLHGHQWRRPW